MGASKAEFFTEGDKVPAKYARALAHPARIAILKLLLQKNTCICGDIVDKLPLSQSTVSRHLKELKQAGLICGDVEGARVCYCINRKEWLLAKQIFSGLFDTPLNESGNCC